MENNILFKYMEQRYEKSVANKSQYKEPGPVVTISRETGCPAKRIAKLLAATLNSKENKNANTWKYVNKEILFDAAKELELDPSKIKYVFKFENRGTWDELFRSLSSRYYKSDRKIRKTIAEVIRGIAEEGNSIIIGRGSVAIAHDIPKSLHINLEAPLVWRAEMLYNKKLCFKTVKEAEHYAIETDKKRKQFRDSIYGKGTDYIRFDVAYNCMAFTDMEIVESIVELMKTKGII